MYFSLALRAMGSIVYFVARASRDGEYSVFFPFALRAMGSIVYFVARASRDG